MSGAGRTVGPAAGPSVPSLAGELLEEAGLPEEVAEHLRLLMADWQMLADLSFADLQLFVPIGSGDDGRVEALRCVGHMRPYTAQTLYRDDRVGTTVTVRDRPIVARALQRGRIVGDDEPDWVSGVPVREEAVPVRLRDEVVAVVTREANVAAARSPSELELTYLRTAGDLIVMLSEGTWPDPRTPLEERGTSPRVGDGMVRLDADGTIAYASPNATSAYRRLGVLDSILGRHLAEVDPAPDDLREALAASAPTEAEVEHHGAVVLRRLQPLLRAGDAVGTLLLVRDVSDLRRQQRELRVKDATIREIHHRVKNNLQTVASLLRLQSRRMSSAEARAELDESVRRISSIALVHETLSHGSRHEMVTFDTVVGRISDMLSEGLAAPRAVVRFEVDVAGRVELPTEVATPLALVATELMQNCVDHAFPGAAGGTVRVHLSQADDGAVRLEVRDDGVGLPDGSTLDDVAGLGTRISRALVESELGGSLQASGDARGTSVIVEVPAVDRDRS